MHGAEHQSGSSSPATLMTPCSREDRIAPANALAITRTGWSTSRGPISAMSFEPSTPMPMRNTRIHTRSSSHAKLSVCTTRSMGMPLAEVVPRGTPKARVRSALSTRISALASNAWSKHSRLRAPPLHRTSNRSSATVCTLSTRNIADGPSGHPDAHKYSLRGSRASSSSALLQSESSHCRTTPSRPLSSTLSLLPERACGMSRSRSRNRCRWRARKPRVPRMSVEGVLFLRPIARSRARTE
mmetsp:Transcript_13964/g.36067  ORF Transcript_13964/g.36067 Transcript_13964/m.36067 type:complete len:242 (-) Transcript_13964:10-735(-)